ncbi:hypothetical protein BTN50_0611 [Candidatus Enterovibrio altilux]|uniref:Uncharacterized protein n=1 Tax=Candidatus Enterovibrio altilux TaxID=1927128 RepID=A0A291B819_9GAMM|nr:hypothetical protein BTN50_0611 [Candidatus Enterovibrio luxaltus]
MRIFNASKNLQKFSNYASSLLNCRCYALIICASTSEPK